MSRLYRAGAGSYVIRQFPKHTSHCVCTTISFAVIFRISQVSHDGSFSTIRQRKPACEDRWRRAAAARPAGLGRGAAVHTDLPFAGGTDVAGDTLCAQAHADLHMSQAPDLPSLWHIRKNKALNRIFPIRTPVAGCHSFVRGAGTASVPVSWRTRATLARRC